MNKKLFGYLLMFFLQMNLVMAQPVEMADGMRAAGKIYVVVSILALMLGVLIVYLFSIDNRLRKLEKDKGKKK